MLRMLAGVVVSTLLFAALIIVPAVVVSGEWRWIWGWVTVATFFVVNLIGAIYFFITSPDLVRERASAPRTMTAGDGVATSVIALAVISFCAAAVYDSLKLQLLKLDPAVSYVLGLIVFLVGIAIIVWTFRVNTFAVTTVEVQDARNQRVITTGPYALVRHPMYLGAIWFFAGVALMLGSPAMAIAAIVVFALAFLPRMLVEEGIMQRQLAGYADYQRRVRSRILPGVF